MPDLEIWNVVTTYYITSPVWMILTVASLIFLIVRSGRVMRKKMFLIVLFALLILFNEFSYHFLIKIFDAASYYRFLWTIPYGMVVAYAGMRVILDICDMMSEQSASHGKEKWIKTAVVLFLCISLLGILFVTQGNYVRRLKENLPQNKYLMSDDVLQVKWLLDQERAAGRSEEIPVLACDRNFMLQYQTIDAGCIVSTSRDVYLHFREYDNATLKNIPVFQDKYLLSTICEDNAQPDIMQVKAALIREEVDYIIVHAGTGMEGYMESLDCSLVGQTTSYLLYRVNWHYYESVNDPQVVEEIVKGTGLKIRDVVISLSGNSIEDIPGNGNSTVEKDEVLGTYLLLNDLHVFLTTDDITAEFEETVRDRFLKWAMTRTGVHSADTWQNLSAILDSYHADGILMAGDMVDFASVTNYDLFQRGLRKVQTPILYARADHDTATWWNSDGTYTSEEAAQIHSILYGGQPSAEDPTGSLEELNDLMVWDKEDYVIMAWNNSTSQLTPEGLEKAKEVFATAKPVILLSHVPIDSPLNDGLYRASQANGYINRARVWTSKGLYKPDKTTQEFLDMILSEETNVCAVLSGHLHFRYETQLNSHCVEYVFAPSFAGNMVRVSVVE